MEPADQGEHTVPRVESPQAKDPHSRPRGDPERLVGLLPLDWPNTPCRGVRQWGVGGTGPATPRRRMPASPWDSPTILDVPSRIPIREGKRRPQASDAPCGRTEATIRKMGQLSLDCRLLMSSFKPLWTDVWFDNETPQKRHRRWRRLPVRWTSPQALDYPGSPEGLQDRARHPSQREKVEQFGWSRVPQDRSFGARFGGLASDSDAFPPKPHGLRPPRDMKMGPVRPSSGELGAVSPIPKLSGGLLSTTNCCFEHVGQLC